MTKKNYLLISFAMLFFGSCSIDIDTEYSDNDGRQKSSDEAGYLFSPSPNVTPTVSTKASLLNSKRWENGTTIKIKFLQTGSTYSLAQAKIMEVAKEWTKYANLTFEFVETSQDADVKIAFNWNGEKVMWSETGTDCKTIAQDQPSMNFALYNTN